MPEIKQFVWLDTTTNALRFADVTDSATACKVDWTLAKALATGLPNEKLVAQAHPHPRRWDEQFQCPGLVGVYQVKHESWGGGASPGDWRTTDSVSARMGHPVPSYIVSPDEYIRLNPGVDSSNWRTGSIRWWSHPDNCVR